MLYALSKPAVHTNFYANAYLQPSARLQVLPVRDQFSAKRKYVETDPALVEEYLERMKQYDQQSQDRFVHIFELQMKNLPKHITVAIGYGALDSGIGWMNGVIRGCLKDRASKPKKGETEEQQQVREEKIFKANQRLSSLTVAQHAYLKHIGREDLVTQYKEWKAARDAKAELSEGKPKGYYKGWIEKYGFWTTWAVIAAHVVPLAIIPAVTGRWPNKVDLNKVENYDAVLSKVIQQLPTGKDYLIKNDTIDGKPTTTISKK